MVGGCSFFATTFVKKCSPACEKKCCEYGDIFIIFTSNISIILPYSSLEYYDIISHKMVPAAKSLNDVKIYVGASSADIKLTKE